MERLRRILPYLRAVSLWRSPPERGRVLVQEDPLPDMSNHAFLPVACSPAPRTNPAASVLLKGQHAFRRGPQR